MPLAIRGSHWTNPILWRSQLLAWLLVWPRLAGVKRVPLTVLALVACAGAAWAGAMLSGPVLAVLLSWASFTVVPASFVPWVPSRIEMSVLPAIEPSAESVEAIYARVVADLQRAVSESPAGRK